MHVEREGGGRTAPGDLAQGVRVGEGIHAEAAVSAGHGEGEQVRLAQVAVVLVGERGLGVVAGGAGREALPRERGHPLDDVALGLRQREAGTRSDSTIAARTGVTAAGALTPGNARVVFPRACLTAPSSARKRLPNLSVLENVRAAGPGAQHAYDSWSRADRLTESRTQAAHLLGRPGLGKKFDLLAAHLSHGEKRHSRSVSRSPPIRSSCCSTSRRRA